MCDLPENVIELVTQVGQGAVIDKVDVAGLGRDPALANVAARFTLQAGVRAGDMDHDPAEGAHRIRLDIEAHVGDRDIVRVPDDVVGHLPSLDPHVGAEYRLHRFVAEELEHAPRRHPPVWVGLLLELAVSEIVMVDPEDVVRRQPQRVSERDLHEPVLGPQIVRSCVLSGACLASKSEKLSHIPSCYCQMIPAATSFMYTRSRTSLGVTLAHVSGPPIVL